MNIKKGLIGVVWGYLGLVIGISLGLLILSFVFWELTFDYDTLFLVLRTGIIGAILGFISGVIEK